jgi:membrane protein
MVQARRADSPAMNKVWLLAKGTVQGFLADGMLSRGAAIAYYTVFSLAPVLVIVIAVAGLVFDTEVAQKAVVDQIAGLMGQKSADLVQTMLQSAANRETGTWATILGVGTLLLTASGVFGEMQSSLNTIWKTEPKTSSVSRLVRARLTSLGLVATLGFLLIVSLVVNAALKALDTYLVTLFPGAHAVLQAANSVISFALLAAVFAAIYKTLPDKAIAWHDVAAGAVVTALLFTVGKTLIGIYLGSSAVASGFGAAGALALVFVWVYYSTQIFLLGAEFTRVFAEQHGFAAGPVRSSRHTG